MYVNPFLAGVIFTIGFELLIFVAWSIYMIINNKEDK